MRLAVIGGSAGAIDALRDLLRELPAGLDLALAIVVHLPPRLPSLLAQILANYTPLPVREAVDKAPIRAGAVLIGPPDYHLLVEDERCVALSRDPPQHYSRPAIDALFESAADVFGARAIGILLTGGNADGAAGLAAIQARGGPVAVQDPDTAYAREMPRAGLAALGPPGPRLVSSPAALGRWLATLSASERTP